MSSRYLYGIYDTTEAHLPLFYGSIEECAKFAQKTKEECQNMAQYAERAKKDHYCMKVGALKDFMEYE